MNVHLEVTQEQFLALNEILRYVRLGDSSIYTSAISDLVLTMERQGLDDTLDALEFTMNKNGYNGPVVTFEYNEAEADGMVINLDEKV